MDGIRGDLKMQIRICFMAQHTVFHTLCTRHISDSIIIKCIYGWLFWCYARRVLHTHNTHMGATDGHRNHAGIIREKYTTCVWT